MIDAIIYTRDGDSKKELADIKWQFEKRNIEYRVMENAGWTSESCRPIIQIGNEMYEGSRQLFNYFFHKEHLNKQVIKKKGSR